MNADESKPEAKAVEAKPEVKADEPSRSVTASKPAAKTTEPKVAATDSKSETKAYTPKPEFRNKIIFALSIIGILAGLVAAYLFGIERAAQPPVFKPISSPFDTAIYANGIIESDQPTGSNINIYPEVSGPITRVFVHEGQSVPAGTLLLSIDD